MWDKVTIFILLQRVVYILTTSFEFLAYKQITFIVSAKRTEQ
jgi:hypothetical protein